MRRHQYRTSVASVLEFYPPQGVASSATVAGFVSGTSASLFASESVTLDTASATVSGHTASATLLTVDDSTGFVVGRRYWAETAGGRGREVTVIDVPNGTSLELDQPIGFVVTAIAGHGLRRTLTAEEAGTVRRRCRVLWTYTVDGMGYVADQMIDIVEMPFALHLTEEDIEEAYPPAGEHAGSRRAWAKVLRKAEGEVFNRVAAEQIEPDLVRERDLLRDAAVYRALQLLSVRNQDFTDAGAYERWESLYEQTISRFLAGKYWYDSDDDLNVDLYGANTRTVTVDGTTYEVFSDGGGGDGEAVGELAGDAGELAGGPAPTLKVG